MLFSAIIWPQTLCLAAQCLQTHSNRPHVLRMRIPLGEAPEFVAWLCANATKLTTVVLSLGACFAYTSHFPV